MNNLLDDSCLFDDNVQKKDKINTLWVEKYRPINVDEYIGNDILKKSITKYIETNDVPNILLYSKESGTGKTTAAKMIVNNIKCDYLYINASSENSVDVVRTKIQDFASTVGFKGFKVIILDECDMLTNSSQTALRNLTETYSKNTRFILTCNYIDKVLNALQSRCQLFQVIPPSQKEIAIHLTKILKKENVSYKSENIAYLVKSFYPDIRKMINFAQQNVENNELIVDLKKIVESDINLKILNIIKEQNIEIKVKFNNIRQLIANAGVSSFIDVYKFLYKTIDEYTGNNFISIVSIIADAQYKDAFVPDKEINFADCILKILKETPG